MKLAFFDYNLNFGGAPRGSIDLCRNLIESGVDVVVFDVYGANKKYHEYIAERKVPCVVVYPSVEAKFIGGRSIFSRLGRGLVQLPDFVRVIYNTRVRIREENVEVLVVNNLKSLVTVVFACLGLGVYKVFYHRGWAEPKSFNWLYRFFINKFCSVLVGHSKATVKNLETVFPAKIVRYVNNCVGTLPRDKATLRNENFTILLPAARPVYEKGHHTALEAVVLLRERGFKNIHLLFPGVIPKGASDEYMNHLHAYIAQHELQGYVKFIGWLESLEEVILNSDVVILPSHTEGFPRVIIEAMLLNTPVVATPVGGIPEAVVDGHTGLLVRVNDASDLASALEKIILDPVGARRLSKNACAYAVENFSKERQSESMNKILAETLIG